MADSSKLTGKDQTNLEELTVIWVDEYSQDLTTRTRLRCIINFLKVFTHIGSCIDYIQSVPNEHLFVIVSGQLSSQIIPVIQDLPQVLHVGTFCDQESLYEKLSNDVNHYYATHSIPMSCLSERSLRDLTKDAGDFFWFRLFVTALLQMPPSNTAKCDLLKLAREFYCGNEIELRRIDDFERNYDQTRALRWYTSDSERARLDKMNTITLYRGQYMTMEDFAKLRANISKVVSTNSFLSTSTNSQVAMIYAGNGCSPPNMHSVLFQITVDLNTLSKKNQHPFADISAYSQFTDEQEVLFSLAAMFRIEGVVEQSNHMWLAKLIFIDSTEEMEEMHKLSEYLGIYSHESTTLANLAQILFLMSDYCRAISFCQKILSEMPDNLPLAIHCLNIMGESYKNEPTLALQSFEQALELQLKYNPTDRKSLATIYNNLGFAHRRLRSNNEIVIHYYEKALEMYVTDSDPENIDWCLVATFLNNMVTADPTSDSNLALKREQLVLDIRLKFLPLSHPLVASTHTVLADIYSSRSEFDEALEHYNEALRIKLRYLPNEHVSIASVRSSIALLYLNKGDYEMSVDQKAAAEESYAKSLELNTSILSTLLSLKLSLATDYELLSFVINNLGVVYTRLNRYDEALEYLSMHKIMITKHLPENHYNYGAILKNIGRVYMFQGKMDKSMEYYMLALDFFHHINLTKASIVAQIYFYMGEWYEQMHQMHRAVEYYERAVELGTATLRSGHPTIKHYTNTLACKKTELVSKEAPEKVSRI
ncbi:unnamed protein product [Rotaria sp. Silwood2]|nr:unnamed protein product [Rotaria sp. Silwood2]CAF2575330.1 unnamed protein product [Rotaria sp. Silwood2]CAF2975538.1 unnamed protein product [Rotaria sp. Silwood2]CAF3853194.1 unnamed protein product [Rotaria sp. Silwood2]CAF3970256.1 unnamed protein product [Rotaria sp. Silwood2]